MSKSHNPKTKQTLERTNFPRMKSLHIRLFHDFITHFAVIPNKRLIYINSAIIL